MRYKFLKTALVGFVMSVCGGASAGLIDRGNGMIYDNVLDITWLADANYSKTSGYNDSFMTWSEANAWAEQLMFGGYSDWRLYKGSEASNSCVNAVGIDYECFENELVHLFMVDLGFSEIPKPVTQYLPNDNYELFQNINFDFPYWSSTPMSTLYGDFAIYTVGLGAGGVEQNGVDTIVRWGAWAVRDGDVASIPEPSTIAIVALGLIGLGVRRFKI